MTLLQHDIRLVLADVDGTLVTREKILTPRAIRAVEALKQLGILFTITSGRPPRGMAMLLPALQLNTPFAGFNGGMMVQPDLTLIEALRLPAVTAEKTLAILKDHQVPAWLYTSTEWLVPNAPMWRARNGPSNSPRVRHQIFQMPWMT